MLYDQHGIDPNPLRDKRVKLPHERKADLIVPLAGHLEAVAAMLPPKHLLPYLMIDWTGLRLGALEEAKVRDLDERRQAFPCLGREEREACLARAPRRPVRGAARPAPAARGSRPRCAALPRLRRREPAHGDHPRLQGDRDAALLPTRASQAAWDRCSRSSATRWLRSLSGSEALDYRAALPRPA
jgi:hypothetical protein